MEAVYKFFEGYSPETLMFYGIVVVLTFWPGFGVMWMNYLKEQLGLTGSAAKNAVIVTLMAFATIAQWVTGQFVDIGPVTLKSIIAMGGVSYLLANKAYDRLYGKDDVVEDGP